MNDSLNKLIYQSQNGSTKIQVQLSDYTVWLTQAHMVALFQTTKQNISLHIRNIFKEGKLQEDSVVRKFRTTAADGKSYTVNYYNLDFIISVGYRVKSLRGTQFRLWAAERLREYMIKGLSMNYESLKQGRGYFDELLDRIRDIRSSEKVFYRKVPEIYATSVDYDPRASITQQFFSNRRNPNCNGLSTNRLLPKSCSSRKTAKKMSRQEFFPPCTSVNPTIYAMNWWMYQHIKV